MTRWRLGVAGILALASCAAPVAPPQDRSGATPTAASPKGAFTYSGELTQGGWIRGQVPTGTVSARLGDQALVIDPDGRFFAAFDRDAGLSATLTARLADGRVGPGRSLH